MTAVPGPSVCRGGKSGLKARKRERREQLLSFPYLIVESHGRERERRKKKNKTSATITQTVMQTVLTGGGRSQTRHRLVCRYAKRQVQRSPTYKQIRTLIQVVAAKLSSRGN